MNTNMSMPITAEEFIDSFKFKDSQQVYTNGAELISVLRVHQMLDYYYRPRTQYMTFGQALERMKDGERVSRSGWNGKGQYVFLAHEADFVTDADLSAYDQLEVEVHDMLVLKTAQDTFQPGWLATQTDMLAEDWYVV